MKVVIVSNTIFPHNQPRAFRATELAKEFAARNHEVISISNLGKFNYQEFSSEHSIEIKNLGPNVFYKKTSDGEESYSFFSKVLSKLLFKEILFPEIELSYRTYNALKHEKDIDLLITLAPSHAIHWGAALFKKWCSKDFPKIWIADCGDPFSGNQSAKYAKHLTKIENWAFSQANYITVPTEESRKGYGSQHWSKIRVIPQGFKFDKVHTVLVKNNAVPYFIYGGIFYKEIRDPRPVLDYLLKLDRDFLLRIYTDKAGIIKPYVGLDKRIEIIDLVSRKEFLDELKKADFAVNFGNKASVQTPSKLIDYAITGKPILQIDFGRVEKELILEFLDRNYNNGFVIENLEQYKIENVVSKFLSLTSKTKIQEFI